MVSPIEAYIHCCSEPSNLGKGRLSFQLTIPTVQVRTQTTMIFKPPFLVMVIINTNRAPTMGWAAHWVLYLLSIYLPNVSWYDCFASHSFINLQKYSGVKQCHVLLLAAILCDFDIVFILDHLFSNILSASQLLFFNFFSFIYMPLCVISHMWWYWQKAKESHTLKLEL